MLRAPTFFVSLRNMKSKFLLPETLLGLLLLVICCSGAEAQSEPDSTDNKIWPEADVHVQLPSHVRLLTFGGLEQGIGYPYQQWYAAAGVGYQLKPILKIHLENIDPDKEHWLVFGGGYEFLRTAQSGKISDENRVDSDGIIHFRLTARNLVIDRNRGEFRWVSGVYSTTYRNLLQVEHDFLLHDFRFTPYGSAEVFYDGAKHSWNQEWYTAGIQWPYKHLLMLETYYRREHCVTCNPTNWNTAGMTLNFYAGNK